LSPNSETILVQESIIAEQTQIQNNIHKNDSTLVAKIVNQQIICHECSPATEMTNPVSFTMESGQVVSFCNDAEMIRWKLRYNID
jgi:hypothetical protein